MLNQVCVSCLFCHYPLKWIGIWVTWASDMFKPSSIAAALYSIPWMQPMRSCMSVFEQPKGEFEKWLPSEWQDHLIYNHFQTTVWQASTPPPHPNPKHYKKNLVRCLESQGSCNWFLLLIFLIIWNMIWCGDYKRFMPGCNMERLCLCNC